MRANTDVKRFDLVIQTANTNMTLKSWLTQQYQKPNIKGGGLGGGGHCGSKWRWHDGIIEWSVRSVIMATVYTCINMIRCY